MMKRLMIFALALMLMPMAFATITTYSYYSFDEGTINSSIITDISGNGNTLTTGTPLILQSGLIDKSVIYSTTNNYSYRVNTFNFNQTADWSVSFWVKPNITESNVGFAEIRHDANYWFDFYTNVAPYPLLFGCRDPSNVCNGSLASSWTNPSLFLTNLTWQFLTFAYQANTTTLKMCSNAVCTETDYILGNSSVIHDEIYIGKSIQSSVFTKGNIDEFGVFDVYLSDDEITTLYNEGNGCSYPFTDCGYVTPSVTLISPADHTMSNLPLDVAYNTTHDGSCGLYIDDVLNQTDATVENSTTQYFNVTDMLTDGTYGYYINCTIGGSDYLSEERHYHYHFSSPLIQMFQPNHDNSTIFTTFSLNWIGNITNTNLTYVNETIRNSTSDIVYSNETITSTTFLDLARTIDANAWGNGIYYYHIYANDELDNPSEEYIRFYIDVCIPAWVCSGYDSCLDNDTQACNAVIDTNLCGEAYGGDYSEFPAQSCNYCTAAATSTRTSLGNTTCQYDLLMTNWAACCDVTQLGSDCLYTFTTPSVTANFTATDSLTEYESCTGYFSTYAIADLDNILADMLGTTGAVFVAFIGLIVLVLIGVWAYRKIKGR